MDSQLPAACYAENPSRARRRRGKEPLLLSPHIIRAQLSRSARGVLALVVMELVKNPRSDLVSLYHRSSGMARSSFYRGLAELIRKDMLYRWVQPNRYYINLNHFHLVKE